MRMLLPDEQWLPQCVPVVMHIGAPLWPSVSADPFAAAVALRDAAHNWIRTHSGESDPLAGA